MVEKGGGVSEQIIYLHQWKELRLVKKLLLSYFSGRASGIHTEEGFPHRGRIPTQRKCSDLKSPVGLWSEGLLGDFFCPFNLCDF